MLGILAGVAVLLAVGGQGSPNRARRATAPRRRTGPVRTTRHHARSDHRGDAATPRIPPARPGQARLVSRGPKRPVIALTFDDGFCAPCVSQIVSTLERTGAHATIFPNGRYTSSWDPVAGAVRRLIARRQLTVGNHTFSHIDARQESASALEMDLNRNETWIEHTFGVTARPFFRPPYGSYNQQALSVAGSLGYTTVVLWSGTVADSTPHDRAYILSAIRYWARRGVIMLMHANYPTTARVLPEILRAVEQMHLRPVTLAELLRAG